MFDAAVLQGGREVGQKANQLPGYRHIDEPEERQYIADVWGIPEPELPQEGAAATEMVHLMAGFIEAPKPCSAQVAMAHGVRKSAWGGTERAAARITALALIASVLGGFYEADNTPDPEAAASASAAKSGSTGKTESKKRVAVPSSSDEDLGLDDVDESLEASDKKAKK